MNKLLTLVAVVALAVLAVGCDSTTTNTNVANSNTVGANANANAARANTNTATVTNANANANANKTPTREDVEKSRGQYEREAKEAGRKIGTGANDMWLWAKARYELAAAEDLRDSTINVDVDNGAVTLTGTVANAAQKTKAETVVKALEGVKSVKNDLKVAAGGSNANANAK
jgi:BON domain